MVHVFPIKKIEKHFTILIISVCLQQSGKSYLKSSTIVYLNNYQNKYTLYIVGMQLRAKFVIAISRLIAIISIIYHIVSGICYNILQLSTRQKIQKRALASVIIVTCLYLLIITFLILVAHTVKGKILMVASVNRGDRPPHAQPG